MIKILISLLFLSPPPLTSGSSLERIERGGSAPPAPADCRPRPLVSWNIERGEKLPQVAAALRQMQPSIVLLQEVDSGAVRTGGVNVAEELAKSLNLNYLFAPEFEELGQGSRARPAYHGQALLTALPATSTHIIRFKEQSDFWQPRWYLPNWRIFQRRTGGRLALVAELGEGAGRLVVYNVHLESRGSEERRLQQINEVIADANRYSKEVPILLAGDLNTRVSDPPAIRALIQAGFRKAVGQEVTTAAGKELDWIFVRGPLNFADGKIHNRVRASDHLPLSVKITNETPGCSSGSPKKETDTF